jgi:hypothetical protein
MFQIDEFGNWIKNPSSKMHELIMKLNEAHDQLNKSNPHGLDNDWLKIEVMIHIV